MQADEDTLDAILLLVSGNLRAALFSLTCDTEPHVISRNVILLRLHVIIQTISSDLVLLGSQTLSTLCYPHLDIRSLNCFSV